MTNSAKLREAIGPRCDAIVIGSGPNGLAAAIRLAQAGLAVCVVEREQTCGGGTRSEALTLPGFIHDVCSAVHPLAMGSPFFRSLPLARHGLKWIYPPAAVAHPFDDGTAVCVERSLERTAERLGFDKNAYRELMGPLAQSWTLIDEELLGPVKIPRFPLPLARFGLAGFKSAQRLVRARFGAAPAAALFAGLAAHSMLPLERVPAAAFGLVLGITAHVFGWPIPKGGSRSIADALSSLLRSLGGKIITGHNVNSLDELPSVKLTLCDVTPRQLLQMAGSRLPPFYQRQLARYRYGMGAYKVDWALDGPIPWKAAECATAATVHLGATFDEIAASERAAWNGEHAEKPFVLVVQPSLFDSSRAPAGKHTAWAYCHVPHGSNFSMLERIETQIERFAPGFRARVLARSILPPAELERRNPNLIGGDINGGIQDVRQLFFRPTRSHYQTPVKGLYLCSSSTPPGGGVHGMCGYFAACAALRALGRGS
ncbi:MAG: phytoene desaturase family protein [Alphaproteobacteria bacterium]